MKHTYLFSIVIGIVLSSCTTPTFRAEDISLIPKPVSFSLNEGLFKVTGKTNLVVVDKNQMKAASYLIKMFERAAGYNLFISTKDNGKGIVFHNTEGMASEAYHLEVTPKRIMVKASTEAGFFNAVQTIRQLLPNEIESKETVEVDWLIPCVVVGDKPRFAWRGMYMDFSRHFFTIDEVKEFLDYMALYKLNTYHMHLTDDQGWRIEIKKYPLLTEKGAWRIENSQDTICKERAVENKLYEIPEKNYKEING